MTGGGLSMTAPASAEPERIIAGRARGRSLSRARPRREPRQGRLDYPLGRDSEQAGWLAVGAAGWGEQISARPAGQRVGQYGVVAVRLFLSRPGAEGGWVGRAVESEGRGAQ